MPSAWTRHGHLWRGEEEQPKGAEAREEEERTHGNLVFIYDWIGRDFYIINFINKNINFCNIRSYPLKEIKYDNNKLIEKLRIKMMYNKCIIERASL